MPPARRRRGIRGSDVSTPQSPANLTESPAAPEPVESAVVVEPAVAVVEPAVAVQSDSPRQNDLNSPRQNDLDSPRQNDLRQYNPDSLKQNDPGDPTQDDPEALPQHSHRLPTPPPNSFPPTPPQPVKVDTQVSQATPDEEVPSSRLIISKMVLINFKSYADRQEIGPFHKSFSSVVGPNGSGKSNVIDALLFVFGYRANKMRQGKLSELIHSSANFPNLDMCGVEVHFQEIIDLPSPDAFEVVPDSQLVVSRQAFRNNSSKYQINGRNSNYTEVTTLLKARGIDLDHKRFLILQGEVESIALMKPKAKDENDEGLLEYLEDIIGTSRYKEQIEHTSAEVEKLDEERSERLNRVKYVEREKNSLEVKKQEAEQYLRNENILAMRKNQLYQMHVFECNGNIEIASKAVNELKAKLQQEEEKHVHIKKEVKDVESNYNATVEEYETIGKETNEVIKELAKYEREDVQMQEKKKHLKTKQKKVAKALQADTHACSEHSTWITNHESDLIQRQSELADLERRLVVEEAELDAAVQSLNGKTDVFQARIEECQRALAPWMEKSNDKKSQIDVAKAESDLIEEKRRSAQRAVEVAERECEELKLKGVEKEKEAAKLRVQIETVKRQITEIEANLQNMTKDDEKVRVKLSTARQKADEAKASLQAGRSRGAVLTSLINMRDTGRIKGIYDRLGKLGTIDDKYDVAISTACPGLDNIVVESVESGQQCIEYLRKNNLGRAQFILLNELPQRDSSPIQTPENVPRLFDLVRPVDPRFIPAFYHVLQNTLVAQDMAQAKRVAYGRTRYRVVTLDGQLIDRSGTMTGGGTRVQRGAMSSKVVADDVKPETVTKLEEEKEVIEEEFRVLQEQRRAAEKEVAAKKEEVPKMELSLEKLELDAKSTKNRLADAQKRVAELRSQNKPNQADDKRIRELQSDVSRLSKELDKLREDSSGIEAEIAELQDKIMKVGGARLRDQKAKVTGIRDQIDTLNDRITKTQVARSKAEKDLKKVTASIAKGEQELADIEAQLKALNGDIKEKMEAALEVRRKADQAQKLMDKKKIELEGLKELLDEKTAVINRIREVEVTISNELENYQSKLKDNENKKRHWEEQRSKLSLHQLGEELQEEGNELQEYTLDELREMQEDNVKPKLDRNIVELEAYIQNAKPNLSVLEEYRRREEEYLERAKDLEEITLQRDGVKREYDDLRKRRLDEFMAGFNVISQKLKEMYQMITLGGNAELELVDSLDPFSEGIVFSVMPPKKSWKNISNLSGGEKTLSSLALVFALHHFKPTPLYVMDEIDAALDFRNVSIVANYIKDRTKNAQFVIISLRNNMFELSSRLVGIFKTHNTSKSVSININQ